jgi:SAM-dependent methyltransferase
MNDFGAKIRRLQHILDEVRGAVDELAELCHPADESPARMPKDEAALSVDREVLTKGELRQVHDAIVHRLNYVDHNLYLHLREASRVRELYYRDVMLVLDRFAQFIPKSRVELKTDHPVAADTDDHRFPRGTAQDNTRLPRFVAACERYFAQRGQPSRPLTYLDLGCAGGGLVLDFVLRGHEGFGIEGSDFSQLGLRAEWRMLRDNLFTADITKPFSLCRAGTGEPVVCDIVSAWEVMEHIADRDLAQLFDNVRRHLKTDGFFVGSIALVPDGDEKTEAVYHRTVEAQDWWQGRFEQLGMRMIEDHGFEFADFSRGTGNGPIDRDYRSEPGVGFHFVSVRA